MMPLRIQANLKSCILLVSPTVRKLSRPGLHRSKLCPQPLPGTCIRTMPNGPSEGAALSESCQAARRLTKHYLTPTFSRPYHISKRCFLTPPLPLRFSAAQALALQLPQSTTVWAWLKTVVIWKGYRQSKILKQDLAGLPASPVVSSSLDPFGTCKQPGHFTSMKKPR